MTGQHRPPSARALLAARIKKLRKQRGMTQEELGAAAGIARSHISAIEHGRCNMRLDSLDSIAGALGVSLQQLFDDSAPEDNQRAPRLPPRIAEKLGGYRCRRPGGAPRGVGAGTPPVRVAPL